MGAIVEFRPNLDPAHGSESTARKVNMEDGHTRISHGLLEELAQSKYKLSGREYMILITVMRKTYGYHKTSDWIALSQFEDDTGIARLDCRKVIKGLVERRILIRKASGHNQCLSINTVVGEWLCERPSIKAETEKRNTRKAIKADPPSNQNNPPSNQNNPPSNQNNPPSEQAAPVEKTADNHVVEQREMVSQSEQPKTKPRKTSHKFTEPDMAFAVYMSQRIDAVNGAEEKRRNLNTWADEIRKMREIDGRDPEQIAAVFTWCNQDDFWQTNIQSPATLRKKFAMLNGKCLKSTQNGMNHENNGSTGQQHRSQQEYINDLEWMDGL